MIRFVYFTSFDDLPISLTISIPRTYAFVIVLTTSLNFCFYLFQGIFLIFLNNLISDTVLLFYV